MNQEPWPVPVRDVILTGAVLVALLALSVATIALPPSGWKSPFQLSIAAVQVALVASFFMKLRFRGGLIRVFAAAGLFWLLILSSLVFADYLTRR